MEPKILGTGLSRTGTKSLHRALLRLGYESVHYPRRFRFVEGELRLDAGVLQRFEALLDTPIALVFDRLDLQFPGSRFIHTVREPTGWLESCRQFFLPGRFADEPVAELCHRLYGSSVFDEELFRDGYARQEARVREYFSGREKDLLVLDVCGGEGWEKLCPFLGHQVLPEPFPHV